MKHIKPISEFLSEAISLKMYKENLPYSLWYDKSKGYKSWDNLFGKGINRITIPLKSSTIEIPKSTPLMEEINKLFQPLGYKINSFEDYLNNKVYKIGDTKNPMKIGGLLNKTKTDLFKKFDTSIERKEWKDKINNSDKDLKIIISRHPYDLLGMSSGRDWRSSSCMRLGSSIYDKVYMNILSSMGEEVASEIPGAKRYSIKKDIEYGVLVAYVVKFDDDNINKPLSRLLIKPYVNEKDRQDILWVSSDKLYGQFIEGFKSSVDSWIDSWQGEDFNGLYCIQINLYSDDKYEVKRVKPSSKWTSREKVDFLDSVVYGGTWKINENYEIDVEGDVRMNGMELTEIPVKFNKVSGKFSCFRNNLTTLKNCPTYVGGYFECSENNLTSLQYCPIEVGKSFYCYSNKLTSLKYSPVVIEGSFNCSINNLTSLQYSPNKIYGYFDCSQNRLTSLEYSPIKVQSYFECSSQKNNHKFETLEVKGVSMVVGEIYI